MMFATRRSLSDARDAIAKQLETVYSSISASLSFTKSVHTLPKSMNGHSI